MGSGAYTLRLMKEERSLNSEDRPCDRGLSAYIASSKLERQAQTRPRRWGSKQRRAIETQDAYGGESEFIHRRNSRKRIEFRPARRYSSRSTCTQTGYEQDRLERGRPEDVSSRKHFTSRGTIPRIINRLSGSLVVRPHDNSLTLLPIID